MSNIFSREKPNIPRNKDSEEIAGPQIYAAKLDIITVSLTKCLGTVCKGYQQTTCIQVAELDNKVDIMSHIFSREKPNTPRNKVSEEIESQT